MKNEKGQVLVLFIILLPLMIMALAITVDLGLLLVKTTEVKSNIASSIDYGLNSNNDDKKELMIDLLKSNLGKDIDCNVDIADTITVTVSGKYESIFKDVFKKKAYPYSFTYKGHKENDKNIIEKEG